MKTTPIIGMSPGNGYFKDDEVHFLLKTIVEKYGKTVVLVADIPAISTYVALGYPQNRARRDKALPQGNNLKNRTKRIASELGYTEEQVRFIKWETEIETNSDYKIAYEKVSNLYKNNSDFEHEADATTKSVLEYSGKDIQDMSAAAKIAVHYLLSEIAFLEFAPQFLHTEKVAYVYHKNWPVYENYISGKFDNIPKPCMDFILLENPYETYNSMWDEEEEQMELDTMKNLSTTKLLRAAFSTYDPAFLFNKETNTFSGIFFEVIQKIAENQGWQIRWKEETGYGVIINGLKSNRFDIFASTAWPTPEREKEADFSLPLYISNVFIWSRENIDIHAADVRIAIKEGDISDSIAQADFPQSRLIRVPQLASPDELLKFVAEDKADITFVEPYLAQEFNKKSLTQVKKLTELPIRSFGNSFMIRKDTIEFKQLLDNEIDQMLKSGFISYLIKKYTGDSSTFN